MTTAAQIMCSIRVLRAIPMRMSPLAIWIRCSPMRWSRGLSARRASNGAQRSRARAVSRMSTGTMASERGNAARKVSDRVKLAFAQTPGDALFLSAIAPAHEGGYFAYLRHLEQVWQPDISIGPAVKGAKYRRIARLQDRFTHALVQRFGLVFMSIGLPTEYEEMRTLHAELIGDGIE